MFLTWHARRFPGEKMSTTSCKSNAQVLYKQRVLTILTLLLHSTNHRRECVTLRFVEVCILGSWHLLFQLRIGWPGWSEAGVPNQRSSSKKITHQTLSHFVTTCFVQLECMMGLPNWLLSRQTCSAGTLADHLQRFSKFLEILHGVKRFIIDPKLPTRPQCSPSLGITSGPLYYVNVVITGTTLLHKSISEIQTFPCLHYFALVTRPRSRDSKESLVANSLRCSRGLSIPHVIDKTSFTVYPHNPAHELVTI